MDSYQKVEDYSNIADITHKYRVRFGITSVPDDNEFFIRIRNALSYLFAKEIWYGRIQHDLEYKLLSALGMEYMPEDEEVDYPDSALHFVVKTFGPPNGLVPMLITLHILLDVIRIEENSAHFRGHTDDKTSEKLAGLVADAIDGSSVNVTLYRTPNGYEFFPATEPIFDDAYVGDILNWLSDYPKSKGQYDKALRMIVEQSDTRDVIDNLRLALELFFKEYFGNNKSLDNQISLIGNLIQSKGISDEIGNMYQRLIDCYNKYNNKHTKHGNDVENIEADYMVYLTGSFMRFMIQLRRLEN